MKEHTYIDLTEPREYDVGISRAEALCRIAEIYQESGEHPSAIKYFNEVIKTYSDVWYGYIFSEAYAPYGKRAIDGVRESSIKAFGIQKTLEDLTGIEEAKIGRWTRAYAQYIIGSIYEKELEDIKRAIEEYKKVLEKYPDQRDEFDLSISPTNMAEDKIKMLTKKRK